MDGRLNGSRGGGRGCGRGASEGAVHAGASGDSGRKQVNLLQCRNGTVSVIVCSKVGGARTEER